MAVLLVRDAEEGILCPEDLVRWDGEAVAYLIV